MVAISRLYNEAVRYKCCAELTHSGGCTANALNNIYHFFISNSRYFAPVILLPLLVKLRRLNRKVLRDTLQYYVECVLLGTITGWSIHAFICVFRRLLGEFRPLTFLFGPSALGGYLAWLLAPARVRRLYETTIFQCAIESCIIQRRYGLTRALSDSRSLQTACFMLCSALILHAKQRGLHRGFWLLVPGKDLAASCRPDEKPTQQCGHHAEAACSAWWLQGLRNYVAIGVTLDIIKTLMRQVPAGVTTPKWLVKLGSFRLHSTAFLASYVSIYRFVHCCSSRQLTTTHTFNHLLAGALAGLSYALLPKLTLLTYALVQSIIILWGYFDAWPTSPPAAERWPAKLRALLRRVPFAALLYPTLLGYLVHFYTLRRRTVSNLSAAVINGLTDKYALHINQKVEITERFLEAVGAQLAAA